MLINSLISHRRRAGPPCLCRLRPRLRPESCCCCCSVCFGCERREDHAPEAEELGAQLGAEQGLEDLRPEEQLLEHNSDVDTGDELQALITSLDVIVTDGSCVDDFLDAEERTAQAYE